MSEKLNGSRETATVGFGHVPGPNGEGLLPTTVHTSPDMLSNGEIRVNSELSFTPQLSESWVADALQRRIEDLAVQKLGATPRKTKSLETEMQGLRDRIELQYKLNPSTVDIETQEASKVEDPLDKGLFSGDVFYDEKSGKVISVGTSREIGGDHFVKLSGEAPTADGKSSRFVFETTPEKAVEYVRRSGTSLLDPGHGRDPWHDRPSTPRKPAAPKAPKPPTEPIPPTDDPTPPPAPVPPRTPEPTPPSPVTPHSPETPPEPPTPPPAPVLPPRPTSPTSPVTPHSPETPPEPPTPPPAPEPTPPQPRLRDRLSAVLRGNKQSREANAASLGLEAEFYAYQKELDEAYAPQAKALSDFLMPSVDASEVMEKAPLTRFMIDTAIETKMKDLSAAAKKEARARATMQAENQGLDLNDEAVKSQIDDAEKGANADLESLPDIMVWRHGSERLRVVAKPTIAKVVDEDGQEQTFVAVAMKTIKNYDRVNQSREDPRAIIRSEVEDDAGRKRKESFRVQFYSLPEDFDASNGLRGLQMSDLARIPMSPTLEWSDQSIHHARGMLYGEVERISSAIDMVLGTQSEPVPKRDDLPERLELREELLHPDERRSLRRARAREQLLASMELERAKRASQDDDFDNLDKSFDDLFRPN